ncbi:MAG TPA: lipid-A-disaccharide synthase N-terminal domain-containing protein, partial [Spirochaetota bacterium]|nr:lipid-A-disaccharide synthase N-terminal domain-containing protein [Spirochaetota bacterium]
IQWIYSEKMKKSVIPSAFWYFSIGGSTLLLVYAILRKDIVFIVGQSSGMIIYLRNIHFVRSETRHRADAIKNAGGKAAA